MARLQDLHPDQQAVLQLVLRRGMAYASIADVLGLTAQQVRERALDAVDGLVPDDIDGLALEDRDRIADHLLDQESPEERQATASWIADDEPARTWAGLVMAEIAPLRAVQAVPGQTAAAATGAPTPSAAGQTPAAAATPATAAAPSAAGTDAASDTGSDADSATGSATDSADDGNDIRQAFAALGRDRGDRPSIDRLPRVAVGLMATLGVLVVVVVALWVTGVFDGGDDTGGGSKAGAPPTTTTAPADAAGAAAVVASLPTQINFVPPKTATAPYAKAIGIGQPNAVDGVPGILFQGEGFPPMTKTRLYAVWIDGGGKKPIRLGWFSDGSNKTQKTIAADGKIKQSFFPLAAPTSADQGVSVINPTGYTRMRITRETGDSTTPGPTVVSGSLEK